MSGLSPKLPLTIDENDGAYGMNKTLVDVVKQNLKMLILTNPGERIMDADFGVGLKRYLFELNTPVVYSKVSADIRSQASKYLPYIEITNVAFDGPKDDPSKDRNVVSIAISYELLPLAINDVLNFVEEIE